MHPEKLSKIPSFQGKNIKTRKVFQKTIEGPILDLRR